ncbi:MAG: DUF2520 domain-containing protein [Acidimicrobiia bacterium]
MRERDVTTFRVIGMGRAGGALSIALSSVGWSALPSLGRGADVGAAASGADLVVIATPDRDIAPVARAIVPRDDTVIAHLSGALGLDVLAMHPRRASLHPLMTLPSAELGAERLLAGAWFAVAGDALVEQVVDRLGGRALHVADEQRVRYHAAATIASNHVVALLGQVERIGALAGVPLAAYLDLVRASVDSVDRVGPRAALTGPVARGDWETVQRHVTALPDDERPGYEAMAELAAKLVR